MTEKTLGQIAHETGELVGNWQRRWSNMTTGHRAEWEAIAEAVIDASGLRQQFETSESECLEQARLLGMSGEREAALLGKIERLEAENRKLRLDCLSAETQAQEHWEAAAAAQAREQQLREALTYTQQATCLAADDAPDSPIGKLYAVVSSAVEQPTDTTALQALIQRAGEVMRDRIVANLLQCGALAEGDYLNAIRALPSVTLEDLR